VTVVPNIARLYISLTGAAPQIWRRVEVSLGVSLSDLHDVIQAVMPWEDCHLFQFEIAGQRYGVPDPESGTDPNILNAEDARLGSFAAEGVTEFAYIYDFGDNWRHQIVIEALATAASNAKYPRFLDGQGRAPPEDVGGVDGFNEFVKTITKGNKAAKQQAIEWYGGGFDPTEIDVDEIKLDLAEIAKPLPSSKSGGTKRDSGP